MGKRDSGPKRPPGRPKGKPLSPAEKAQRRAAPWKHGQRAQGMLRHFRPCRPADCPLGEGGYPCDVRRWRDGQGRMTDVCLAMLSRPELEQAYREALAGNGAALEGLTAGVFGALLGLLQAGIAAVQDLGVAVPVLAQEPPAEAAASCSDEKPVLRYQQNPAIWSVLELAKLLGLTGDQHLLTPKAEWKAQRKKTDRGTHLKTLAEIRERAMGSRRRRRRR